MTVDHVATALTRLRQQYRGKAKTEALVTALTRPAQALEDALQQLLTERSISAAVGDQLDVIGSIVGQKRNGAPDDLYKRYLRARIATNRSTAALESIIKIASLVLDDDDAQIITKRYNHSTIYVRVYGIVVDEDVAEVARVLLSAASAAGVRVLFSFSESLPADTFCFAGGAGKGFKDYTGEVTFAAEQSFMVQSEIADGPTVVTVPAGAYNVNDLIATISAQLPPNWYFGWSSVFGVGSFLAFDKDPSTGGEYINVIWDEVEIRGALGWFGHVVEHIPTGSGGGENAAPSQPAPALLTRSGGKFRTVVEG